MIRLESERSIEMDYSENTFIKKTYNGSDGENFRQDFIDYLESIIANKNWQAMSDYTYFLQGGKKAIEEIISEIKGEPTE